MTAAAFVIVTGAVMIGSISYRNYQSALSERQGAAILSSENEYSTQSEQILTQDIKLKSADEYEDKPAWNKLTKEDCEALGIDFEVVSTCINLLKNMADGDVVEIGNFEYEQLRKSGVLSSLGVVYMDEAEIRKNDIKFDLTVYLRQGISHSMLMPEGNVSGKVSIDEFKGMIENEIEESSAYSGIANEMCVGSILTYIPYEDETFYSCGAYVKHNIYKIPDIDQVEDYYGIHTIHSVVPPQEAEYCMQYYRSRTSAMYEDEFFLLGNPNKQGREIDDNNREMNISAILWAAPMKYTLDVIKGTQMKADHSVKDPPAYWITFENRKGLYSPESQDGRFTFETTIEFVTEDGRIFTFLHEQYMRNTEYKKEEEIQELYSSQEIVVPRELALHITDLKILNQTEESYTIEVSFTKEDAVRSRAVQMATWTEAGGQDDLVWHVAVKDGNTAVCTINKADHNNESGRYITHVYIRNGEDGNEIMQPIEIDME